MCFVASAKQCTPCGTDPEDYLDALDPSLSPHERFLLARSNVALHAKANNKKFNATGHLWLSNLRLFFVADGSSRANCDSFDLPLATMIHPAFNQPIFGANNVSGASPPLPNSACQGNIKWTLSFNSGGVGTFLPLFFRLVTEMRTRMSQPAAATSTSGRARAGGRALTSWRDGASGRASRSANRGKRDATRAIACKAFAKCVERGSPRARSERARSAGPSNCCSSRLCHNQTPFTET